MMLAANARPKLGLLKNNYRTTTIHLLCSNCTTTTSKSTRNPPQAPQERVTHAAPARGQVLRPGWVAPHPGTADHAISCFSGRPKSWPSTYRLGYHPSQSNLPCNAMGHLMTYLTDEQNWHSLHLPDPHLLGFLWLWRFLLESAAHHATHHGGALPGARIGCEYLSPPILDHFFFPNILLILTILFNINELMVGKYPTVMEGIPFFLWMFIEVSRM